MKKATLIIEGMHCSGCASNIERSLSKVKGVKSASVNLLANKGFAEMEDSVTDADLQKAVKRAGYAAKSISFEVAPASSLVEPSEHVHEHKKVEYERSEERRV